MPIIDYRKTDCNIHNSAIMAAPIGCVSEFDNSKEIWCTYIERIESVSTSMTLPKERNQTF